MKKELSLVKQVTSTQTNNPAPLAHPLTAQKNSKLHTFCNHSHNRINRFPFGSNFGPSAF